MKKIFLIGLITAFTSCNVDVDHNDDKDSTSGFDTTVKKIDNKLEEWGDTAKEKFKDVKEDVKDRFKKDTSERKDR
jgi:hypothetical protein